MVYVRLLRMGMQNIYGDKELTKVKTAFKDIDASVDEIIKKGLQLLVK